MGVVQLGLRSWLLLQSCHYKVIGLICHPYKIVRKTYIVRIHRIIMKTKVTQDKTQTRATIPKKLVDKHKVTKKDSIEWDDEDGKLKGELIR